MERKVYEALGETVWRAVLPNGLHIYVEPRPEYSKQFAFFATRYGGLHTRFRDEDGAWRDTPAGVAHFLEHKMFDTEEGNALQIMAAGGVEPNAFTSSAVTGYYFEGTQNFEESLRTLLSFVSVPWFTQESVDKEQGIIAQEIRMGEDSPDNQVFYGLMKGLYRSHPIREELAGTVESIAQITADTLYTCHRAFYHPGNMVLCVAGNVDPERVEAIARKVLPDRTDPVAETDLGPAEEPEAYQALVEKSMAVSAPLFQIGFKGEAPAPGEEQRQRLLGVLAGDVLFGVSSPLYSRLYEEGLINNSFSGGYEAEPGCAFLSVGGESRFPEKVRDAVLDEAERIAREGVDPELWERLKKSRYGTMVKALNSLENVCIETAMAHFEGAEFLDFPRLFLQVTGEDAQALIGRWCRRPRTALSVIRPKEE